MCEGSIVGVILVRDLGCFVSRVMVPCLGGRADACLMI